METVQAVCEPDLGHALTTSQSIPRSFIIDRTSSSYSGFTTIISCGGFCKRKSGPTIRCPINGTKWPCLRGFISTTQSTPEPAVNRSKFRNVTPLAPEAAAAQLRWPRSTLRPSRRCWSSSAGGTALAGDNYFRAKAHQRAADTLSALVEPLDRVIAENRLCQLPGIGETIADIVTKFHNTGTHPLMPSSAPTRRGLGALPTSP
jgi:Helix-hairpin-helix domain